MDEEEEEEEEGRRRGKGSRAPRPRGARLSLSRALFLLTRNRRGRREVDDMYRDMWCRHCNADPAIEAT